MVKKNITIRESISRINEITNRMPKKLSEMLDFEASEPDMVDDIPTDVEEPEMGSEMPINEPEETVPAEPEIGGNTAHSDAEALIADIRKKALRAMADLADTPEDPNYETLKKIFTMLEKAVTDKQEQREVLAKNPKAEQEA